MTSYTIAGKLTLVMYHSKLAPGNPGFSAHIVNWLNKRRPDEAKRHTWDWCMEAGQT